MRFNHLNLVVTQPEASCRFYQRYVLPDGEAVWLGNSLHLRNAAGTDLAFQAGSPAHPPGAHHGFIAPDAAAIDGLQARLAEGGITITEDCREPDFRSIKFPDPDGYEIEVYWEAGWTATED
ncbi:MAG: VOC family protein [Pseudomonadota bacterium]